VQRVTLSERLARFIQRGREQAQSMQPGEARDEVLQKVRQAESAIELDQQLRCSPKLA
jgi:hypothetical protein